MVEGTGKPDISKMQIKQPDIPVLPTTDPMYRADLEKVEDEWIRAVVPQVNEQLSPNARYDVDKLLKGHALHVVSGDDNNFFYAVTLSEEEFKRYQAEGIFNLPRQQAGLLTRLRWEIKTQALDARIKAKIESIYPFLQSQNKWESQGDVKTAYDQWLQVKNLIEELLKSDPEMAEAREYYFREFFSSTPLRSLYNRFITEKLK